VSLVLDEPVELRDCMRSLAAVAPARARSRLVLEVALLVAEAYQAEPHQPEAYQPGATQPEGGHPSVGVDIEAACRSYARELWLWLVGERTWEQCVSGLGGRLLRRSVRVGSSAPETVEGNAAEALV
jgi:hypothetical protein